MPRPRRAGLGPDLRRRGAGAETCAAAPPAAPKLGAVSMSRRSPSVVGAAAAARPRADAADRRAAGGRAAAAAGPAGPAGDPVRRRGRRCDLPQPRPAVRHRRRGRLRQGRQRRGGPGRRGLLPGRQQRRPGADDRAGRTPRGLHRQERDLASAAFKAKAIFRLSVPLGILSGVDRRRLLQPLRRRSSCRNTWPSSAAGGSCRSSAASRAWRWRWRSGLAGARSAAASTASATASSRPGRSALFAYGVLNRLLIVTGLHHILNNVAWFIIGDFHGAAPAT